MDVLWGPWAAAKVAGQCAPLEDMSVDEALALFGLPVEGWHESVARAVSEAAYLMAVELPESDERLVAWFERRPQLRCDVDLSRSGVVLVRASDGSVCMTVGRGWVAESWGGGLSCVRGVESRYRAAFELPESAYLTV